MRKAVLLLALTALLISLAAGAWADTITGNFLQPTFVGSGPVGTARLISLLFDPTGLSNFSGNVDLLGGTGNNFGFFSLCYKATPGGVSNNLLTDPFVNDLNLVNYSHATAGSIHTITSTGTVPGLFDVARSAVFDSTKNQIDLSLTYTSISPDRLYDIYSSIGFDPAPDWNNYADKTTVNGFLSGAKHGMYAEGPTSTYDFVLWDSGAVTAATSSPLHNTDACALWKGGTDGYIPPAGAFGDVTVNMTWQQAGGASKPGDPHYANSMGFGDELKVNYHVAGDKGLNTPELPPSALLLLGMGPAALRRFWRRKRA